MEKMKYLILKAPTCRGDLILNPDEPALLITKFTISRSDRRMYVFAGCCK